MAFRTSQVDVAIIGAGAAGIGAALRLHKAGVETLLIEARNRIGGRAHTIVAPDGTPIDMGCGWLHSADRNPWTDIAKKLGFEIDKTRPPWDGNRRELGMSRADLRAFNKADDLFWEALDDAAKREPHDRAAADFLPAGGRWNAMIDAISTYINGAELERVSIFDTCSYDDTEVNWRAPAGYGRLIAVYGKRLPLALGTTVERIDHRGSEVVLATSQGTLRANAAIVTLPTDAIAQGRIRFDPDLADKREAAAGLPLGNAEKVYFALDGADEFPKDTRFFGAIDRVGTGAYHMRPFGRPIVEAYFGGRLARHLAIEGPTAMVAFAIDEIAERLGAGTRKRLKAVANSGWAVDPFALGSYSHALPGCRAARKQLAASIDDRLFFAGEACSPHDFSTAHGAFATGRAVAKKLLKVRGVRAEQAASGVAPV